MKRFFVAVAAVTLLGLVGCGGDDNGGNSGNPSGGGGSDPMLVNGANDIWASARMQSAFEVLGYSSAYAFRNGNWLCFQIYPDGTCYQLWSFTYFTNGNQLCMRGDCERTYDISGNTLTIASPNIVSNDGVSTFTKINFSGCANFN
jgi:hypothetical protein